MQLVLLALHQLKEAVDAEEAAIAFEHEALLRRSEVIPRHVQRNTFLAAGTAQLRLVGPVFRPGPRIDGPIVERLALVGNDQVDIEVDGVAEALAAWACPIGIVEREEA